MGTSARGDLLLPHALTSPPDTPTPAMHHLRLALRPFLPAPPNPALPSPPLRSSAEGAASGFRYFWMSDSCPSATDVSGPEGASGPFEVLSLAGPIAAALQI